MSDSSAHPSVGAGLWTPLKQDHFRKLVDMHLRVTDAVLKKNDYYSQVYRYIDATAGPGRYSIDGKSIIGSPLLFLDAAEQAGRSYDAQFIEQEPEVAAELQRNLPHTTLGIATVHLGDYRVEVPALLPFVDLSQLGLLYIDPSTGIPDFATIAAAADLRPRMEVLMYLSATNLKRDHNISDEALSQHIAKINKDHWLVRKPARGDGHRWTFLLGSNSDLFKNYKSIEFYRLNSPEAQEFFPILDLTDAQRHAKLQPRLFE